MNINTYVCMYMWQPVCVALFIVYPLRLAPLSRAALHVQHASNTTTSYFTAAKWINFHFFPQRPHIFVVNVVLTLFRMCACVYGFVIYFNIWPFFLNTTNCIFSQIYFLLLSLWWLQRGRSLIWSALIMPARQCNTHTHA